LPKELHSKKFSQSLETLAADISKDYRISQAKARFSHLERQKGKKSPAKQAQKALKADRISSWILILSFE
jgi:hypothetical protein